MKVREWFLKNIFGIEDPENVPHVKFIDGDIHLHFHINFNLKKMLGVDEDG